MQVFCYFCLNLKQIKTLNDLSKKGRLLTISFGCWWLKNGNKVEIGMSPELPSSFLAIAVSPFWFPNGYKSSNVRLNNGGTNAIKIVNIRKLCIFTAWFWNISVLLNHSLAVLKTSGLLRLEDQNQSYVMVTVSHIACMLF